MIVKSKNGLYIKDWIHHKLELTGDQTQAHDYVEWVAKGYAKMLNRMRPEDWEAVDNERQ